MFSYIFASHECFNIDHFPQSVQILTKYIVATTLLSLATWYMEYWMTDITVYKAILIKYWFGLGEPFRSLILFTVMPMKNTVVEIFYMQLQLVSNQTLYIFGHDAA